MSASLKKYGRAFDLSQVFLDILKIDKFPLDIIQIFACHKTPIFVSTLLDYQVYCKENHLNPKSKLTIKDAKCFFYPERNTYLIIYNDKLHPQRVRFSLAHELGHIVLGHLKDSRTELSRGGLDDPTYYFLEGEANTFAGNILAPPILIHEILGRSRKFSTQLVSAVFDISTQAVDNYRRKDYQAWLQRSTSFHERNLLARCTPKLFVKYCVRCGNESYGRDIKYCPICGNRKIGIPMQRSILMTYRYKGVEISEEGRVVDCIKCDNHDFMQGADFCQICGAPIVNYCVDATKSTLSSDTCQYTDPLPGNARYCPYCGSVTTFFQAKLLSPWDKERYSSSGENKLSQNESFFSENSEEDPNDLPF